MQVNLREDDSDCDSRNGLARVHTQQHSDRNATSALSHCILGVAAAHEQCIEENPAALEIEKARRDFWPVPAEQAEHGARA